MTTPNQYAPDEHAATRILAAFVQLGNEIAALQLELQLQRERADEATRDAADARTAMHEHATRITWDAVQRLMVQSGIQRIERDESRPWLWLARAMGGDTYFGDNLDAAVTRAASAWAASGWPTPLGKAVGA